MGFLLIRQAAVASTGSFRPSAYPHRRSALLGTGRDPDEGGKVSQVGACGVQSHSRSPSPARRRANTRHTAISPRNRAPPAPKCKIPCQLTDTALAVGSAGRYEYGYHIESRYKLLRRSGRIQTIPTALLAFEPIFVLLPVGHCGTLERLTLI
jgi:hypothetical protein